MSIRDEINRLAGNVTASLDAVGARGVDVPAGANSNDLATLIAAIPAGGTQADWNVNDPADPAYINNRPFYESDPVETVIVPAGTDVEYDPTMGVGFLSLERELVEHSEYFVTFNGVEYKCVCAVFDGNPAIGNLMAVDGAQEDTGEPFVIVGMGLEAVFMIVDVDLIAGGLTSFTLGISARETSITKIDKKFIPDLGIVGKPGGGQYAEVFNGDGCYALGEYSHAQNYITKAGGPASHAEGRLTEALGNASHAEGWQTVASQDYQHVQGKYNLISSASERLAHIVGNGTSSARSNAHTLDWSGNAWYAGTIEGTALILKSPNGTRYKVTVSDAGALSATKM